ncbi:30S ribosomal protein S1 [Lacticigenium naphthae]|uniref:30S ribosomal protein S1 n=1 Tax=Lacticigenium naphthae TaxID=515351 RepID=UPI0006890D61|nr:30S ribosomal protein S1 [Lacticigenium naphthae]
MAESEVEVQATHTSQDEESPQTMSDVLEGFKEITIGDTVRGKVLAIEEKQVIVGLENGQEGVIPFKELASSPVESPSEVVEKGEEIEVVVIKEIKNEEQGGYLLSKRRVDAKKIWEELERKYKAGEIIEAPVTNVVKGGLVVDVGVRGFIPASLVDTAFVDDFSAYKGNTYEYKIIEIEPSENRLILSRKALLEEKDSVKKDEILDNLVEGSIVTGKVARLTDFGAFVDLGGVDGLVHISQISHEHVKHPSDKLEVGEEIEVKILSVDKEKERISLSIKETLAGPWDGIEDKVQKGDVVDGTVKRLTDFGAFVEVFPGVEGLVHISQISHKHIATPHEVLTPEEKIQVKVLEVNPTDQRLSLSIKALEEKPETDEPKQKQRNQPKQEKFQNQETETGFTFGDLLGDQLSEITGEDSEE